MGYGDRVARWWAHRKLHRNQCDWCGAPLPDTGSRVSGWRACCRDHAVELKVRVGRLGV